MCRTSDKHFGLFFFAVTSKLDQKIQYHENRTYLFCLSIYRSVTEHTTCIIRNRDYFYQLIKCPFANDEVDISKDFVMYIFMAIYNCKFHADTPGSKYLTR